MLHYGGNATALSAGRRPQMWPACLASSISTQELRVQLDQLHSEAQRTRAKANNARLRLMRLSEAAEKLRRQAAVNVQTGREAEARELLFQKKKVMQALEKSKSRITLLDELSSKLSEAISLKETKLIEHVASDLDIEAEDTSDAVIAISPKDQHTKIFYEDEELDQNSLKSNENQESQVHIVGQADLPIGNSSDNIAFSLIRDFKNEVVDFTGWKGVSSYEDFLRYLDLQLKKIEAELVAVLRVSTLVLEGEENTKNSKVQQTVELLKGIRQIRERISSIAQTKVGT